MAEHQDQEFLEYLVKSIVDNPDDVTIERKIDEMGVLLSLRVNRKDMGQVVGREGSTAKAIRSLLRIVGVKNNSRVNLKIEEPEGGQRPERKVETPAPAQEEAVASTEKAPESDAKEEEVKSEFGTVEKVIDDIKNL